MREKQINENKKLKLKVERQMRRNSEIFEKRRKQRENNFLDLRNKKKMEERYISVC